MKLVTWNVNSIKARLPRLLELLELHQPDVVCVQETKVTDEGFPRAELAEAGYASAAHCSGRWAGVGILTRAPLTPTEAVCGLPGEAVSDEARWVEATVDGVRVASVYVPNGRAVGTETYDQKLVFYDAMARRIAEQRATTPDTPLIVAGDMNVCPTDLDVYDPAAFVGSTHVSEPERAAYRRLLDAGLVDAFRHLHPDDVRFTWWDYRAGHFHKKLGLRIDFVLVTPDLAERLESCGIDRNFRKGPKPSDHAPLLASFRD